MRNKALVVSFILVFGLCFAQNLEETIYVATEEFNQNQNNEGLEKLERDCIKFETKLSTSDEYYAFINLIINKAYYLSTINKQTEAISNYEKAYQIYYDQKITSYNIIEYCLIPLGILYHKTNSYIKAEQIITLYISLAQKQQNEQQQASGYINLAKLYQSLNKHQQVIKVVNESLNIKTLKRDQKQNLNYIKKRSEVLLQTNETRPALEHNLISPKADIVNAHVLQLNYEAALKNKAYNLAYSHLNRLKDLKINQLTSVRTKAKFYFQEAQLYFLRSESERALAKLKQCLALLLPNFDGAQLPEKSNLFPENTFIDIFDLWAELQNDPEKALDSYDLSFFVAELLAQENTDQESFIINASTNKDRSEKCIALLYDLFILKRDSSYVKRAFRYAELNKALALKRYSNKRLLLEKNPQDSLLIKEHQLLKQQQKFISKLFESPATNKAQQIARDSLQLQLITISTALKSLQTNIAKTYPSKTSYILNFTQLTSKLKLDNACLLEYFYGKNAIYQFIITSENIDLIRINASIANKESISSFIRYFDNASVINNNVSKFTIEAFNLYNLLNLSVISSYKNVIVVADGLINFIPFESLLTKASKTLSYSEMPFLVRSHRLVYNISALFYVDNKAYVFNNSALGVFPVFKNSELELTYSIEESERLNDELTTKFLMYNAATKKNVLDQISNFSIIHLSTHANSGNFTVSANINFVDSKLHLQDLYNLDLKNDLVVLSACETGVGVLNKGEGSMSLARGFKYAGVSNMVVSLWKINDLSTSQLMSNFYSDLRKTESAFYANQNSKLDYLNNKNIANPKKSPYYWGAFIYFGDLTEPKSISLFSIISFSIIAFIIIGLIWALRFKRQIWKR